MVPAAPDGTRFSRNAAAMSQFFSLPFLLLTQLPFRAMLFDSFCRAAVTVEWASLAALGVVLAAALITVARQFHARQSEAASSLRDLQWAQRAYAVQSQCHEREVAAAEEKNEQLAQQLYALRTELHDAKAIVVSASQERDALADAVTRMNVSLEQSVAATESVVNELDARYEQLAEEAAAIADTVAEMEAECDELSDRTALARSERAALSSQRAASQRTSQPTSSRLESYDATTRNATDPPAVPFRCTASLPRSSPFRPTSEDAVPSPAPLSQRMGINRCQPSAQAPVPTVGVRPLSRSRSQENAARAPCPNHTVAASCVIPEDMISLEADYKRNTELNDYLLTEVDRIWNTTVQELVDRVALNKDTLTELTAQMETLQQRNELAAKANGILGDLRLVEEVRAKHQQVPSREQEGASE